MTCSRVLILHDKKIIMADAPDNLQQLMSKGGQVVAEIAAPLADLQACWEQVPEIEHFNLSAVEGDYVRCALTARAGVDLRPLVYVLACERQWPLRELSRSRHSLEDIFMRVTRLEKEESF